MASGIVCPSMLGFGLGWTCTAVAHTVTIAVCSRVQLSCRVQVFPYSRLPPSALFSKVIPEPWRVRRLSVSSLRAQHLDLSCSLQFIQVVAVTIDIANRCFQMRVDENIDLWG